MKSNYNHHNNNNHNNKFDIVIPVGPNEQNALDLQLQHLKQNVHGFRNIYLIPFCITYEIECTSKKHKCIVIEESMFSKKITKESIAAYFQKTYPGKKNRNGWYFQQYVKLYAGIVIPGILDKYLVVDADVFFVRPIDFIADKTLFATGKENHAPYFEHMKKLHPLFRKMTEPETSGICHHMMFETKYVKEMMRMVEDYDEKKRPFSRIFLESVTEHLNYPRDYEESGASEYELYFHFMLQFHSSAIQIRELAWKNSNKIPTNKIEQELLLEKNENKFDYISICHHM